MSAISNNQPVQSTELVEEFDWEDLDKLMSLAEKPKLPSNEFVESLVSHFKIDFTKLKVQPSKKEDGNVSGK